MSIPPGGLERSVTYDLHHLELVLGRVQRTRNEMTAQQQDLLKNVTGKSDRVLGAISRLAGEGVVIADGTPRTISFRDGAALELYMIVNRMKDTRSR